MKKIIFDNIKTLIYALIIALLIRTFLFQPFYIPSSSMEPNLLIGDRLFVSKFSYGYSKHSFPFSPSFSTKRFFKKSPERGDIVVFKTPVDNRTDYIKRIIGLPGDKIQFIDGDLFINNNKIVKKKVFTDIKIFCGKHEPDINAFKELLPNGKKYTAVYHLSGGYKNSDEFVVPEKHYFFLGDNRDCSKDSRFLSSVGYVNEINLVGKAQIIFFSNDKNEGSFFKFWKWNKSIRVERLFKNIN
tara:strand:- start:492 stop:1220 length:729 start_codon:yes stop_codon:yes gene_type:complete